MRAAHGQVLLQERSRGAAPVSAPGAMRPRSPFTMRARWWSGQGGWGGELEEVIGTDGPYWPSHELIIRVNQGAERPFSTESQKGPRGIVRHGVGKAQALSIATRVSGLTVRSPSLQISHSLTMSCPFSTETPFALA